MATPRLNDAAIEFLLKGRGGLVDRAMSRHAANVERLAKALAPAETGNLKASITTNRTVVGDRVIWHIGSPLRYARYPNCGTGVYAGKGRIYPRRAKYLVFEWKGRLWRLDSVAGQPAQRYMIEALRRGQPYPVTPLPCS
ncbi:HK97 gp10 family phage protein [Streptomyces noursei]|uniref:HK97 gp10 family phage protein n=1 Tax=Streptomyces noursei TaxID=1971 RepID=UPI00344B83C6